jgi:hypothetical protein
MGCSSGLGVEETVNGQGGRLAERAPGAVCCFLDHGFEDIGRIESEGAGAMQSEQQGRPCSILAEVVGMVGPGRRVQRARVESLTIKVRLRMRDGDSFRAGPSAKTPRTCRRWTRQ